MTHSRVLIVDDEPRLSQLLARMLSGQGKHCTTAANATEALRMLERQEFELVLCDVNLPGTSGLELVRLILAEYPQTAAVMVSGSDDPAVASTAIEYGAYGYVIKPFRDSELMIAIANALRRRALEIENRNIRTELERRVRSRTRALRDAVRSLEQSTNELRLSRRQTIALLSRALQYRDEETADHIERMSRYCALLGERLGLDAESMRLASAMHDIGKIGVPDRILRKPGRLTPAERRQMERHAEIGHQILARSGSYLLDLAAIIALSHHERWDGGGYPHALSGTEIPLEGRIAAVADVFDALTSDRVYRPAMSLEAAVETMAAERGRHFDPAVFDVFMASLDELVDSGPDFAGMELHSAVVN